MIKLEDLEDDKWYTRGHLFGQGSFFKTNLKELNEIGETFENELLWNKQNKEIMNIGDKVQVKGTEHISYIKEIHGIWFILEDGFGNNYYGEHQLIRINNE